MGALLGAAAPALISVASGWIGNRVGKSKKVGGDRPVNRVLAPAAAIAGPAIAAGLGLDLEPICAIVQQLCASPGALGLLIGAATAGVYNAANGASDAVRG